MARPKTDLGAARRELLDAAEALLKRHGAERLTVSAIAAACSMSQSNAYRFFASKKALLGALGERWFAGLEGQLADVAAREMPPETALLEFLEVQLASKRDRHDADRELFLAYLQLGRENPQIVQAHLREIRRGLAKIVARFGLEGGPLEAGCNLIEDLTVAFRDPYQIAARRERCERERARAALEGAVSALSAFAQKQEGEDAP